MLKSYDDRWQVDGSSEGEEVLADSQRLNYPTPPTTAPPINFVLTEFHVLLLYPNRVIGVSVLNQSMVFEDFYNEVSHLICGGTVVFGPPTDTVWDGRPTLLYTTQNTLSFKHGSYRGTATLFWIWHRRERVALCVPVSLSISRYTLYYNNSAHLILQFFTLHSKNTVKCTINNKNYSLILCYRVNMV